MAMICCWIVQVLGHNQPKKKQIFVYLRQRQQVHDLRKRCFFSRIATKSILMKFILIIISGKSLKLPSADDLF